MGRNAPESPSNTKKRRRTTAANSAAAAANTAVSSSSGPPSVSAGANSVPGELAPPPPITGYGDTVYASNPFDDMSPIGPAPGMGRGRPPSAGPQSQFMMGSGGMPMANGMTPPGSVGGMYGPGAGPMGYPMAQVGGMPMPNGLSGPGGPMMPASVQASMAGGPVMSGPGVPMNMGPMAGNMSQMMNASPTSMGPGPPSDMCGPMTMAPSGALGPAGKLGMGGGGPGGVSPSPSSIHSSRKVYPPDQPMVFNPQNPNAPPIYPCGMCHKEVHENDQAILCESGCNFWFHRMCTGLIEQAYHLLIAEVYAEWVCDRCLRNKNIPLIKFKP